MKNLNILKLFLFAISMSMLISCSKDNVDEIVIPVITNNTEISDSLKNEFEISDSIGFIIYDYPGIDVILKIKDEDGNDLLNPEHPNTLVNSNITFYHGEDIKSVYWQPKPTPESRLYLAYFRGAIHKEQEYWDPEKKEICKTGDWILVLSDFPSIEDYEDEVIIKIKDKSFTLKITNKHTFNDRHLICDTHFYIDGKEQESDLITLTF
ncbi:MAG: hypothetical protein K2K27_05670 [Muribaculaceae bacterium]|nr:hypothetical protein [Muribaculaceae bacterium]